MKENERNIKNGIIIGVSAYLIWGLLPIYWKLLDGVRPDIVLAHRIIWSFIFIITFLVFTNRMNDFIEACKSIWKQKKKLLIITAASLVISANWLIFIWTVNSDKVIQASLGYYINPLMSVLLGVLFLKEKLSKAQIISVILAGSAVTYLTFSYGIFPWASLTLAASFAIYGLLKKLVDINSMFSLGIETMIITPAALILLLVTNGWTLGFAGETFSTSIWLILSGVATAVPLILFGSAVRHLPLSFAGFLQYIAPTIMLVLGVFLYGEEFTTSHFITFILIWISLILFMASSVKQSKKENVSQKKAV